MATNNPILNRMTATANQSDIAAEVTALQSQFDAPARAGMADRMAIDDVVAKTGAMFAVLLAAGAYTWMRPSTMLMLVGAGLGFVLAMVNTFKRNVSPTLVLAYSACQGLFLGGVSRFYEAQYQGIVSKAVLGTIITFAVMLALYSTKVIRVTGRTTKIFLIAMVSYVVLGLVSWIATLVNPGLGGGYGFFGTQLGLLLCLAGVGLAAFSLVMDFESVQQAIVYGAPRREAWRASFGIVVSLVWLYLELLRLLATIARMTRD
ncbi:MAG: Bax inhibitor-1/YccA family protein [Actinomycetales bacterium]|nr:Bax inhibitor-1/YccA family protein [Actinomycetales bacterium]